MTKVNHIKDSELDQAITNLQEQYKQNGSDFIIPKDEQEIFGFKIVYSFIRLSKGWIEYHRELTIDEIFYCVKEYGSKDDRIQFNKENILGDKFSMPITRKEIALDNKEGYKSALAKHQRSLARNPDKRNNKQHKRDLEQIRSQGFSILRRTKKNIGDNLFKFIICNSSEQFLNSIMNDFYIEVKGIKNQGSIPCLNDAEDLLDYLTKLKKTDKYKDIIIPELKDIEKQIAKLEG